MVPLFKSFTFQVFGNIFGPNVYLFMEFFIVVYSLPSILSLFLLLFFYSSITWVLIFEQGHFFSGPAIARRFVWERCHVHVFH